MKSFLRVHALEIPVRIGVTDEERRIPQAIQFDVEVFFSIPPKGCETDLLSDSLCYDDMSIQIEEKVSSKSFKLIEHLCYEVFEKIKEGLPEGVFLKVSVKKLRPPLRQTNQGVSFELIGEVSR